jgi:hypothetical protein
MGCCCQNKTANETVTNVLGFKRSELVFDLESYAFVTADIMEVKDEHLRHQVFDIAQEGNADLVTRQFNLAHAEVIEALYPYTKVGLVADERFDDVLQAPEEYDIEMTLPSQFSRTTVQLLREYIHDYFICHVLVAWLGITDPQMQPYWKERLAELKEKMRLALLGRRKPLRRKQSLF